MMLNIIEKSTLMINSLYKKPKVVSFICLILSIQCAQYYISLMIEFKKDWEKNSLDIQRRIEFNDSDF